MWVEEGSGSILRLFVERFFVKHVICQAIYIFVELCKATAICRGTM